MDKQRDFEKGWEEYEAKRKQEITEIASDLSKAVIQDYGGVYFLETAEELFDLGYRKIPEGAVVLTKEQNEKWLDWLELNMAKARKETAEKFLERLKEPPYKDFTEAWVADEIAKEFTGGKE